MPLATTCSPTRGYARSCLGLSPGQFAARCADRPELPREHWTQIAPTNPLERVNREIRRRTDVIGLVETIMLETSDEWTVVCRYTSLATLARTNENPNVRLPAVAPRSELGLFQRSALLHHAKGHYRANGSLRPRLLCAERLKTLTCLSFSFTPSSSCNRCELRRRR
jgi:hypothetical protein